jgi:hypothetical protein
MRGYGREFVATILVFAFIALASAYGRPHSEVTQPASAHVCGAEDEWGWVPLICGNHMGSLGAFDR